MNKGTIAVAEPVNINSIQSGYAAVPKLTIELIYTQANVTCNKMNIVTATTLGGPNAKNIDAMVETTYGVLISNSKGSLLVPWANVRTVIYK